jgi:hypothetical protein
MTLGFEDILFGIQHGAEVPEPNEDQEEVHLPVPPRIVNNQGNGQRRRSHRKKRLQPSYRLDHFP